MVSLHTVPYTVWEYTSVCLLLSNTPRTYRELLFLCVQVAEFNRPQARRTNRTATMWLMDVRSTMQSGLTRAFRPAARIPTVKQCLLKHSLSL